MTPIEEAINIGPVLAKPPRRRSGVSPPPHEPHAPGRPAPLLEDHDRVPPGKVLARDVVVYLCGATCAGLHDELVPAVPVSG